VIADFVKMDCWVRDLADGVHAGALNADADTLVVFLTDDVVNKAVHQVKADLTEIDTGQGYDGPVDIHNSAARIDGVIYVGGIDVLWTGTGPGAFGPFRYAVLCNQGAPGEPLIGYWDYGTEVTISIGEQFGLDIGDSLIVVA